MILQSLPDWISTRNNVKMKRNLGNIKLEKPEIKLSAQIQVFHGDSEDRRAVTTGPFC